MKILNLLIPVLLIVLVLAFATVGITVEIIHIIILAPTPLVLLSEIALDQLELYYNRFIVKTLDFSLGGFRD